MSFHSKPVARSKVPFKVSGRPRVPECVRKIVKRMAVENVLWGYERIVGELKKIGCRLRKTTVKRILKEEGIHPLERRLNEIKLNRLRPK